MRDSGIKGPIVTAHWTVRGSLVVRRQNNVLHDFKTLARLDRESDEQTGSSTTDINWGSVTGPSVLLHLPNL